MTEEDILVIHLGAIQRGKAQIESARAQLRGRHPDIALAAMEAIFHIEKFLLKLTDEAKNIYTSQSRYEEAKQVYDFKFVVVGP